jgi:type I restriction enzyme S subunit
MRSGPSWKREQEGLVATPTSIPVIGITDTLSDGRMVLGERTYVDGLPAGVQLLDASSLVLIRTNGNRARIGNVYRAAPEVEGHAVSAFQIALRPHKASDRDYLFRVLHAPSTQASITQAASGSTGLGNIAISWLKALEIPWPDVQERMEFAETCERLEAVAESYRRQVEAVRAARSTLLESMLSGVLTLPDTYDRFLEAV